MCAATSEAHDRCMDNSLLYYTPAEIEYRQLRARRSLKPRRRMRTRAPWRRRPAQEETL